MKITNQQLAELFKSALVAYENEPNKGTGPDGYCYDVLTGGRVALEMAAKILLQPPPDRPEYDDREIRAFLRERLLSVIAPEDPAVEAVRDWLRRQAFGGEGPAAEKIVELVRKYPKYEFGFTGFRGVK